MSVMLKYKCLCLCLFIKWGGSKKKGGRERKGMEIKGKIIGRNSPNYYSN